MHHSGLGYLTGRWLRSVTETELHVGYGSLHQVALHHGYGYWLIDVRRCTNCGLNGPEWVNSEFLLEVQRALGLRCTCASWC